MYRRYRERRRRRNRTEYRRRSVLTRPAVQIAILLVTALIIFILLQSGAR
jgi:cell division septal protein FtsQ